MKRTLQPKKKSRQTTHGFRVRSSSASGRKTLKNRRLKGRRRLTV